MVETTYMYISFKQHWLLQGRRMQEERRETSKKQDKLYLAT
jgi:hypothetical protein